MNAPDARDPDLATFHQILGPRITRIYTNFRTTRLSRASTSRFGRCILSSVSYAGYRLMACLVAAAGIFGAGCATPSSDPAPHRATSLDFKTMEFQSSTTGDLKLSPDGTHIQYHSEGRTTSFPVGEAPGLFREAVVDQRKIDYTEPDRIRVKNAKFKTVEHESITLRRDRATPVYQIIFATSENQERVTVWKPRPSGKR
ncbi:MAG: hypothetical protein O2901_13995 [Verrucomicrobia bacterium]|nr:hypothetical protein [Verrucomicrobiota bacterium]